MIGRVFVCGEWMSRKGRKIADKDVEVVEK
jgi:ribosome-associated protein YbcJ (S4-like RNA binding protein)